MADDSAQEDSDGQGHNSFLVCHARVRSRASTVQPVPGGSAAIQCLNPKQQLHCEKDLTCWHATELTVRWLLIIPRPVCYGWSHTILLVQGKAAKVWTHWSWSFCCGPQGEAIGSLDTLLWYTSKRAQQQTLHLPSMVCPLYLEGPGHTFAIHPSYIHASWSPLWHCSQRGSLQTLHTLQIETGTWTYNTSPTCDLCSAHDVQDEQHVLFHCTHPHVVSLRRTYASLFLSAVTPDLCSARFMLRCDPEESVGAVFDPVVSYSCIC